MTLQETNNFFESLKAETTNKSEIKVYEKFLHILTRLKTKEFSNDDLQSIETTLDNLNLKSNPENKRKYFNKALVEFEKYLKETYSLIPKSYYTQIGIAVGMSFGILFGIVFLSSFERSTGISLGLCGGMLVGLLIGRSMDAKAETNGKVL